MSEWRDGCFEPEDVDLAAGLAPGDPRGAHVETCARCAALLAAYRSFVAAASAAGADPDAASARLAAFLGREILGEPAAAPPPARAEVLLLPARRAFPRPVLRAALAAAAVVLIAGGIWLVQTGGDRPAPAVMRGATIGSAAAPVPVFTADPRGGLDLAWQPVPTADAYEVRILDSHLDLLRRLPAPGPVLVLPAEALSGPAGGGPLLVQVVALADGDTIATGPPVPVPVLRGHS